MYFYVTLVLGDGAAVCAGCAIPGTTMDWGVVPLTDPLCEAY